MPPGDGRGRPGRSGPVIPGEKISTNTLPRGTDVAGLTREFGDAYRLGYGTGFDVGHAHGVADEGDAWTAVVTGWAQDWRRPRYAELEARRVVDHRPCPARCGKCSRCVCSEAWQRRGGRPYFGVRREAELAGAI